MGTLLSCLCAGSQPPYDRLTLIYQAARELAGDETLPEPACVAGVPPLGRLSYIYAAFRVLAEDDSLPSQECIEGEPFQDQVTRIYEAVRAYATDDELPDVFCVYGTPLWQQFLDIYRALYSASGEPDGLTAPDCIAPMPSLDILTSIYCAIGYLIENANPIVISAAVQEDGATVLITFNQPVTGNAGFSFTINGDPHAYSYGSGDGTEFLVLQIEDANIVEGDVVLMSYAPGSVVSVATGNPLEAFSDFPVTNPFDVFYYLRPDGVSRYLRPDGVSFYTRP